MSTPAPLDRRAAAMVLLVLATANVVSYADRNLLASVYDELRHRFAVSNDEIGLLGTLFMLPHAIATVGFGWIGDNRNRKWVLGCGLFVAGAGCALTAVASDFVTLAASRVVVGIGTAAIVPVAVSIIGERFAGPRKASFLSLFNLGLFIGGAAGMGAGTWLGFPGAPALFAAVGAGVGALCLFLPVSAHRSVGARERRSPRRVVAELLRIRTLRWLIGGATAMAFAAGGYAAWFIDFLREDKAMTDSAATSLFAVAVAGGLPGVLVGGRLGDYWMRTHTGGRLRAIVVGMGLAAPCALLCVYLPTGIGLYAVSMATMFFVVWYHAPMAAVIDDLAKPDRSATAQGLVIFIMHLVGTASSSWIIGAVSSSVGLREAMLLPTLALATAAVLVALAARTYATDVAAANNKLL